MLGAGVEHVLVASSGLGRLALELPAARVSGWLLNEAPAGRGPVAAWLERGEQQPSSGVPVVTSHGEGGLHDGDHRYRSAQSHTRGGGDRRPRTADRAGGADR